MATNTAQVTIPASESLSDAAHIFDNLVLGLVVPSDWTDATVTFQGSIDNTTFYNLNDADGAAVSVTVVAGEAAQTPDPLAFAAWNYIKARSGTSASGTVQSGDRIITLLLEENL